mgnify:FL=1
MDIGQDSKYVFKNYIKSLKFKNAYNFNIHKLHKNWKK